jgi:hypothetical protein
MPFRYVVIIDIHCLNPACFAVDPDLATPLLCQEGLCRNQDGMVEPGEEPEYLTYAYCKPCCNGCQPTFTSNKLPPFYVRRGCVGIRMAWWSLVKSLSTSLKHTANPVVMVANQPSLQTGHPSQTNKACYLVDVWL